jgi:hypothetical protein
MKKLIVPVLVIAAGITSAFSSLKVADDTIESGYIRHDFPGNNCEVKNDCERENTGTLCRVGQVPAGAQLWLMNTSGKCVDIGYKPV